ncbi:DUF3289 family protein [Erwinia sp. 9145]|uniref:DUF3289 family protein n=1 Tax=Erwinia sp. 9145 TaxID=1500895 RepID=UPI000557B656|nr:DUF3289 family protein [Erwinia sp. 9145]
MSDTGAVRLPCTLFRSQRRMDDYFADDMRCGDLSEQILKAQYALKNVSETIDPWSGERLRYPFGNYAFARPATIKERINYQDVANQLFDEMRQHSWLVSFFGHRELFLRMVNHMQHGNGMPFSDSTLNFAYEQQIRNDRSEKSTFKVINDNFREFIDWKRKILPPDKINEIRILLNESYLPRFDRWIDRINGLGISVHAIHATCITLKSLQIEDENYTVILNYKAQDHFGLDDNDIMTQPYHNMPLFRIWFTLQRWNKMAYKPFMVNMNATIKVMGRRK